MDSQDARRDLRFENEEAYCLFLEDPELRR